MCTQGGSTFVLYDGAGRNTELMSRAILQFHQKKGKDVWLETRTVSPWKRETQ